MVEDFRDLLAELVKANARFLIVGAHALSVHGIPRATADLDNKRASGRTKDLADLESLGEH